MLICKSHPNAQALVICTLKIVTANCTFDIQFDRFFQYDYKKNIQNRLLNWANILYVLSLIVLSEISKSWY